MATRPQRSLTTPSGRPAAFGTRVRERIDTTKIVKRLQATALGADEMTQNEIAAARILLNKTVPDLKPIESGGEGDTNAKDITNHQLLNLIEGTAERVK